MIFTLPLWQVVDIVVFSLIVGMWLPYVIASIVSRAIVAEIQKGFDHASRH
jgi:hypothetical protein